MLFASAISAEFTWLLEVTKEASKERKKRKEREDKGRLFKLQIVHRDSKIWGARPTEFVKTDKLGAEFGLLAEQIKSNKILV